VLFDVRTADCNGWSLATVVGDLDLATLPALRTALDRLDGVHVGLDLSDVAYLDAVVLGVVLGARVKVRRQGGEFVVVCPPGGARDLLVESGVAKVLTVLDSLEELEPAQ